MADRTRVQINLTYFNLHEKNFSIFQTIVDDMKEQHYIRYITLRSNDKKKYKVILDYTLLSRLINIGMNAREKFLNKNDPN